MCEELIHRELLDIGESICFLCDELLDEGNTVIEQCCDTPNIEAIGVIVCLNCGCVMSSCYDSKFIDFYQNIYKIKRKSIYYRKYHIENTLNSLQLDKGLVLTHNQRNRIYKVFNLIGTILNNVNRNRRRMISVKFIICKILNMMEIPCNQIPITRSKRTLKYYDKYWYEIDDLIGDRIRSILLN